MKSVTSAIWCLMHSPLFFRENFPVLSYRMRWFIQQHAAAHGTYETPLQAKLFFPVSSALHLGFLSLLVN